MGNPKNKTRRKRVKFHGNRFTSVSNTSEEIPQCSSAKKVKSDTTVTVDAANTNTSSKYFMMDFEILVQFILRIGKCPTCGGTNLQVKDDANARMGFAHKLQFLCMALACTHKDEFYTSGTCNKLVTKQGRNKFEVNVRTVASS